MPDSRAFGVRFLISVFTAFLFLLVISQTMLWSERAGIERLSERGKNSLNLYIANLRGELEKFQYLPASLAKSEEILRLLRQPDSAQEAQRVNQFLFAINEISGASDTYVMDRSGYTLAASNSDMENSFVGRNFGFRPYFQDALQGRLGRYYALGTTSAKRGYYFAYPVRDNNELLGVVVVKVNLTAAEQDFGGGQDQYLVTDPDGVVFLSTESSWKFKSMAPLTPDVMDRIRVSRRYDTRKILPLPIDVSREVGDAASVVRLQRQNPKFGGAARASTWLKQAREMPEAGWRVHILSNLSETYGAVFRSVLVATLLFAAAVMSVLFWLERRRAVTERAEFERHAQEQSIANERRIRAIIDNTEAGLATVTTAGVVESINPRAEDLFEISADAAIGRSLVNLLADRRGNCAQDLEGLANHQGPIECLGCRPDQSTFPIELTARPIETDGGRRFIVTIHDITERMQHEEALRIAHDRLEERVRERTNDLEAANILLRQEIEERRRAEETLQQTQAELVQAAKLAGLGQMSAGISHELNQPLAAIRTYADNARALMAKQQHDRADWNLEQISELTVRMAKIIKQLKAFARKAPSDVTSVEIAPVLDNALELLRAPIERAKVSVTVDVERGLVAVAEVVQLEQVFVNLITNALQAMEGSVERTLRFEARGDETHIEIRATDSGPGIAEDDLGHLFDPFFTTKEVGQGLGLGLSICYRIIEGFGGYLRVRNVPEGGAQFIVQLKRGEARSVVGL